MMHSLPCEPITTNQPTNNAFKRSPPPGFLLVWRADLVHCGAAYPDHFNARFVAYVEVRDAPPRQRRKRDRDGATKSYPFPEGVVEKQIKMAGGGSSAKQANENQKSKKAQNQPHHHHHQQSRAIINNRGPSSTSVVQESEWSGVAEHIQRKTTHEGETMKEKRGR